MDKTTKKPFVVSCRIFDTLEGLVLQFPLVMMKTPRFSRVQRWQKEVGESHRNLLGLLMMLLKLSIVHQEAEGGVEVEVEVEEGLLVTSNKQPLMQLWGFNNHRGLVMITFCSVEAVLYLCLTSIVCLLRRTSACPKFLILISI